MGATQFQAILQALRQLTFDEVTALQGLLATARQGDECCSLIEAAAGRPPCPRCACPRCHRSGAANGLQRYRCTACGRTFNALTGTPLARLRLRDKWLAYLGCLLESTTVRAAAGRVAVAPSTSFRWRHRFIAGVRRERRPKLSHIVEADETYLLESQKGSRHLTRPARKRGGKARRRGLNKEFDCILVARDRSRVTHDFVTGRGPVSAAQLKAHLLPVLAPEILLISDAAKAYQAFAQAAGLTHEVVNVRAGIRARGAIHIQSVNGWHSRFKGWLQRFHGVASRYLANYTGWQRVLDAGSPATPSDWLRIGVAPGRYGAGCQ
ncbi:IS1595 family transposase [Pseudoduganella armeniaca]|uniref:IS1595 family transposase n=1 Tax=Pseudoduganella armeniaca TaxID=2072590 RepID=A0A2R4CC07_9BURK|nr:IS1595 family transposase [Pseudoduganella armeniaca]AVR97135.1 IS1595 family transposase [Pseudoduganella armeniaca]